MPTTEPTEAEDAAAELVRPRPARVRDHLAERPATSSRAGQHVGRLERQPLGELPDGQEHERRRRRAAARPHARAAAGAARGVGGRGLERVEARAPIAGGILRRCVHWPCRRISSRSSSVICRTLRDTAGDLDAARRGRSTGTPRPRGRAATTAARRGRPSRTASRTLWVTNSTVSPAARPDRLELVVQHVARHRVERARRARPSAARRPPARARARSRRAGACRRRARAAAGSREALEMHELAAARAASRRRSLRGDAAEAQRQLDVALHRSATGSSAGSWNISATRRPPTSIVPRVDLVQADDQVEQRALAAARGAEQADELARRDRRARRGRARGRRSPGRDRPARRPRPRPRPPSRRIATVARRSRPSHRARVRARPGGLSARRGSCSARQVVDAVELDSARAGRPRSRRSADFAARRRSGRR